METLAIVAYRQPALRAQIEAIRGVQSGEVLRQLIERDLVRIAGRSNELGRPFLYGTTKQFLQVFGLRRLDELPKVPVFQASVAPAQFDQNTPTPCDANSLNHNNPSPVAGEEENAMTLSTNTRTTLAEEDFAAVRQLPGDDWLSSGSILDQAKEEEEFDEEDDDFDDEEDEDFEEEEEEEEDEDLEDEPWEEVEEEDEEDEDWDEDEDWEDEDWDEDEEEEEEEEEDDEK
jgi:segregation and condensation protein B